MNIDNIHQKKKILHLLYSGLGGHGSVFTSLVEADERRDYDYFALFGGIEPVREEYVDFCKCFNIPFKYVKKKKGLDLKVHIHVLRILNQYKPDIIFIHSITFIIPVLVHSLYHSKVRTILRDTQNNVMRSRLEWLWLFLSMLYTSKVVFLTSKTAEGVIQKLKGIGKERTIVIPNGLDIEKYRPGKKKIEEKLIIGMQSRLQPIKDHPTLLKAFKQITELPDFNITLKIAGDGVTKQDLKQLTKELQIDSQVEFCGMLGEAALIKFMQSVDIYVHATYGETMSNSIMQAMACGLPIIASRVTGVENMIDDYETGLLYTSEDVDDLSSKIKLLLQDEDLRLRLGKNARSYAVTHFSNALMYKRYKAIFE